MVTETLELTVFHCVVRHSSYAKAAEELGLSPSGVSRIVTRLEERLGARLVQRTTRKLSLTEAGAAFHARTLQVLLDLAEAEAEVQEVTLRPRGHLRISAPVVFGRLWMGKLVHLLLERYPELTVDLSVTNRFVDLVEEGMDLAIRIGSLSDSRIIARRLCTNLRVLVASPTYIAQHGMPQHPNDLVNHECIVYTSFPRPREWKLLGPDGLVSVQVSGRFAANNAEIITDTAKQGRGITLGATLSIGAALLSGELVRVLPQYTLEPSAVFAVYPSARQLSSKVRAAVDFMAEQLQDPPTWDRELAGRIDGF